MAMTVHFASVRPIELSGQGDWHGFDVHFERAANRPPFDSDVEDLRRGFETAVRKLHLAAQAADQFMPIFNRIISAAGSSLATDGGAVQDGLDELNIIKQMIVDLNSNRRRDYFLSMLKASAIATVIGLLIMVILLSAVELLPLARLQFLANFQDALEWLLPACLVLPGAALGILFVVFAANRVQSYDDVGRTNRYGFSPWQQFIWVAIISYVLLAALWFKLFVLGVGNVLLNDVTEHAHYGFLIGLVCGISEALVAEQLLSLLRPGVREQPAMKANQ